MGRLTQMIEYINSEPSDWNTPPVKIRYTDFTHFNITDEAKKSRRSYRDMLKEEKRITKNKEKDFNSKDNVYFIHMKGTNLVKIGQSNNIPLRLHTLQVGSPYDLEIVKTSNSLYMKEGDYHKKFQKVQKRGEWYLMEGDLKDYIEQPHWRETKKCQWSKDRLQQATKKYKEWMDTKGWKDIEYPIHCF